MMQRARGWLVWLAALGLGLGVGFGCTALPRARPPEATATVTPEPTPWPLGRVEWEVHVPEDTPAGATVVLRVWDLFQGDEAVAYPLSRVDNGTYRLNLTWPVDQLVFYRFELQRGDGTRAVEHTAWGAEVAYRAVLVTPRAHVREHVQRWSPVGDGAVENPAQVRAGLGRLEGTVLDAQTGQPVPDILVLAGGHIARTDSQGRFRVEGLKPGAYNVVFYHPDARYIPWQQEALVAAAATTPVQVRLQPTRDVELTLEVQLPEGTVPGVPVRVVGTLRRLGLLDAPTRQGRWIDPMRAPQILPDAQGRYRVTLRWPVGVPVRYAYTLGDGRVGRERDAQGTPRVRSVRVTEAGARTERVARWAPADGLAVWFEVDAGAMPPGEVVTLQFAQGDGWLPPVPMWPLASGRWGFLWYGERPEDGTLEYRYCRNAHCPWAAEAGEEGPRARQIVLDARPDQRVDDQVVAWQGYRPLTQPVAVVAPTDIAPRGVSWVQGVALAPYPAAGDVEAYGGPGMRAIEHSGARVLILTVPWALRQQGGYPHWQPVPGLTPDQATLAARVAEGHARGLRVWLMPVLVWEPGPVARWWGVEAPDFMWWQAWYERLGEWLIGFGGLATRIKADGLIVATDGLEPSLRPHTHLPSGALAHPPADAQARWAALLQQLRQVYRGPLWWAPGPTQTPDAAWLQAADGIVLTITPEDSPGTGTEGTVEAYVQALTKVLATRIEPWVATQKPILVQLVLPSAQGAPTGCIQPIGPNSANPPCLPPEALALGQPEANPTAVDLDAQRLLYNAWLLTIHQTPQVQGVISAGFYPYVAYQGPSASIYAKPAYDVVRFWYARWQLPAHQP